MIDTYVFDASALIALFRGYEPVYDVFEEADLGHLQILFPAAAVAAANTYIQATEAEWAPLLMGQVTATPLTEHIAIVVGSWPGELAVRHVVYEARATRGDVVTLEPYRYRPWTLPLLAL